MPTGIDDDFGVCPRRGYFPVQGSAAGTAMGCQISSRLAVPARYHQDHVTSPVRHSRISQDRQVGFELLAKSNGGAELPPSPAIARRTAESTNVVARASLRVSWMAIPTPRARLEPADGDDVDRPIVPGGAGVDGAFNECEEGVAVTATHIDAGGHAPLANDDLCQQTSTRLPALDLRSLGVESSVLVPEAPFL